MTTQTSMQTDTRSSMSSFSSRDLVAVIFRYKRPIVITFWSMILGSLLAALLAPADYQGTTKFLVERSRVDPVVSPTGQPNATEPKADITEEELNSEVALVSSQEVMRQVVVTAGLDKKPTLFDKLGITKALSSLGVKDSPEQRIEEAELRLTKKLKIEPLKKSHIVSVTYTSSDPQQLYRVLKALDDAYLQRDVAVHHPQGEYDFFNQETESYKKSLADAESQLKAFSEQEGGVSPQLARDIALQKLSDFTATLRQVHADVASTQERIDALEKQSGATPQRLTTQLRTSDDAAVLQGLKTTLMNLELRRTELLTKYKPDYPLVQEMDKELAETKASIATEEAKPLKDETTDQNPTYAWINEELAKAKADKAGLEARAAATESIIAKYEANAHDLEQKGIQQQDLLRKVKTEEDNYLLYQRKREEARMSDALDRTRILNVAIAEAPVVPVLPYYSRWLILGIGALLTLVVCVAMAFGLEYANPSFRTPTEVFSELNIPVLASVPHHSGFAVNGNGNGHAGVNGNGNGNGHAHSNGNGNGNGLGLSELVGHDSSAE